MKKFFTILLASVLSLSVAQAVPAYKGAFTVQQPDGSSITLRLHGDEYLHFRTTDDGYSVVRDTQGYYVYAQLSDGQLVPTAQRAHDAGVRSQQEQAFLSGIRKYLCPAMRAADSDERQAETARQQKARTMGKAAQYDYTKFRGLVILVEYNDCEFVRSDYQAIMNDIMNTKNYRGFDRETYTGSVRDYFYDNSFQQFDPTFDVIGPVKLDRSKYYVNSTSRARQMFAEVIRQLDDEIDFSEYDTDQDGWVDMVYFVVAGAGAHMGNDERLLWPHASALYTGTSDGVSMGRYACSVELYGRENSTMLDGIGTICHEFGHVLGLPDLYDTDYEGSGGQSVTPGNWSVMAGGSYNNYSRTPVGYSLYERYAIGFATPKLIEEEGDITLESIDDTNEGYRLNSGQAREYFLLENRQRNKWNRYAPGSGMLVFRVDSTNTRVWDNNTINANPAHNYYVLLRAKPASSRQSADSAGDPFPGTGNVTELSNNTAPASLLSWSKKDCPFQIEGISEANGVITFTVKKDTLGFVNPVITEVSEDFEEYPLSGEDYSIVTTDSLTWFLNNAKIEAPDEGNCNGKQAIGMTVKSTVETHVFPNEVKGLSYTVFNPTAKSMVFRCYVSTDYRENWSLKKSNTIVANSQLTVDLENSIDKAVCFKFEVFSGLKGERFYVDDFSFVLGGHVDVVTGISETPSVPVGSRSYYDLTGRRLTDGKPAGRGVYIATDGKRTYKVAVK